MRSSETEDQLVREHVEALAELYFFENRGRLLRIAYWNAGANMAVAEEAFQEALISFLGHYDPRGPAPPLPWLILTLKRECWRRFKRERYDRRVGQEHDTDEDELGFVMEQIASPGCVEELIGECDDAGRRLSRLKSNERLAIELQAAGFSYKEIASSQDWTYTKTDRSVRHGRAKLRPRDESCPELRKRCNITLLNGDPQ